MASWGTEHNYSIIILLAVLFGSCSGKEEVPTRFLSKEEMTHVMIEIHILEAKVGRLGITVDSAKMVYNHLEKEVFAKSGTDSSSYFESFDYYSEHPDLFSAVYNAVVDSLLEMDSREKLKREAAIEAIRTADSLGNIPDSLQIEPDPRPRRMNIKTALQPKNEKIDTAKKSVKLKIDGKQPE